MAGTYIRNFGTIGINVTADAQTPVVVTTTGTIDTAGPYAILDSAPSNERLVNHGAVISTASGGIGFEAAGTGTVKNLGLISGGAYGVYTGGGKVRNYGTITATGTAGIGVLLQNSGTMLNGSTGSHAASISGGYDGVQITNGYGTVDNFGAITGATNDGIEVYNRNGGFGIVSNGAPGTLTSYLIQGAVNGVAIGNGYVGNWGTLIGTTGAGVSVGASGTVSNGDASNPGQLIRGVTFGVVIGSDGFVTNFGSIAATGTAGIGILLGDNSTVVNGSAGTTGPSITGAGTDGVQIMQVTNSYGTVDNFGTIIGATNDGIEIDNRDGGSDTVVNGAGALIRGVTGIALGGPGTVTTAGTIVGTGGTAIQFGNSNDTLVLQAGARFVGVVNGGGGSNIIELAAGTGTTGNIGSAFVNFGQLSVDAGATWTLTGGNGISAVLNDGTLRVGASASLDISGGVSASSTGIFSLLAGATLDLASDTGCRTVSDSWAARNWPSTTRASSGPGSALPATPARPSKTSSPAARST